VQVAVGWGPDRTVGLGLVAGADVLDLVGALGRGEPHERDAAALCGADLPAAPSIQWTNRNQGNAVDRETGFRVDWEGGDAPGGVVLVAGISTDTATNASAVFVCTAPSGSKTFSVPSYIVQALPPSSERPLLGLRPGYAMVGFLPLSAGGAGSTSGLDAVLALVTSWSARAVYY